VDSIDVDMSGDVDFGSECEEGSKPDDEILALNTDLPYMTCDTKSEHQRVPEIYALPGERVPICSADAKASNRSASFWTWFLRSLMIACDKMRLGMSSESSRGTHP
jgi:hypothetical protein